MKRFTAVRLVVLGLFAFGCGGDLTGPRSPSTPTNVTVTPLSSTSVRVDWTPSPLSDGVISYSVFRNGTKVGESITNTYTDTGLTENVTYTYTVAANCESGIVSDESAPVSVTTQDATPPRVVANVPANGAANVSLAATATVTFSEAMNPATINTTTFSMRVTSSGAAIPGTVTYNPTTRVAEFDPTGSLPNATNITVTVTTGAKDVAGNSIATSHVFAFTTRDEVPPSVTATSPAAGATGVAPNATISVTFNEAVDPATVNTNTFQVRTASGSAVAGTVAYNAATRTATFTSSAALAQSTSFTVTVTTGVRDPAGNALASNFAFTFTTGDVTAPAVVSTVPADLATGVAPNAVILATFSEAMDPATITTSTFVLFATATGTPVTGTVAYDAATRTASFTPAAPLQSGATYTAAVTTGVRDLTGNPMGANKVWTFIVADAVAPTVIAVSPANGAPGVAVTTAVTVTFSEPVDPATVNTTTITLRTAAGAPVTGTVTYNSANNTATFTPGSNLAFSTGYQLTVSTGIRDVAGNPIATNFTSSFTTAAAPDTTAPTVVATTPANNAMNVSVNSSVSVRFSEAMDASTVTASSILLRTSSGTAVPGTVSYDAGTNTATFTPASALANGTAYTLSVTTAVEDAAGNALASTFTSSFTTAPAPDTTPPNVVASSPANNATEVAVNSAVSVTFNEALDPSTVTTTTFSLSTTAGATVSGSVTYNAATNTATFTPSSPLLEGTSYTATLTTGIMDVAGNPLAANHTIQFTTAGSAPTVDPRTPAAGATNVARNTLITATFSEAMNASTINTSTFTVRDASNNPVTGTVTYDAGTRTARFTPSGLLAASMQYTVTLTTGIQDASGTPLASQVTWTFTTGAT